MVPCEKPDEAMETMKHEKASTIAFAHFLPLLKFMGFSKSPSFQCTSNSSCIFDSFSSVAPSDAPESRPTQLGLLSTSNSPLHTFSGVPAASTGFNHVCLLRFPAHRSCWLFGFGARGRSVLSARKLMCEARASVSKAPVHRLFGAESYWESQGALICISNVDGSAVGQMV